MSLRADKVTVIFLTNEIKKIANEDNFIIYDTIVFKRDKDRT